MPPIKVLLVDDFEAIRKVVASIVDRAGLQVIGEASDGAEAVRKAKQLGPDLVLLDISLPTFNGIEVAKRIREVAPDSKILFLSQETSTDVVLEVLRLGARGYVHKVRLNYDLLPAIEAVLHGGRFVSSNFKSPHIYWGPYNSSLSPS